MLLLLGVSGKKFLGCNRFGIDERLRYSLVLGCEVLKGICISEKETGDNVRNCELTLYGVPEFFGPRQFFDKLSEHVKPKNSYF